MSDELLVRILTLGIPFIVGLFVPQKSKKEIDDEVKGELDKKFGKK